MVMLYLPVAMTCGHYITSRPLGHGSCAWQLSMAERHGPWPWLVVASPANDSWPVYLNMIRDSVPRVGRGSRHVVTFTVGREPAMLHVHARCLKPS